MGLFSRLSKKKPAERIRISKDNIASWPKFQKLVESGQARFDNQGRLRYTHGAPVGDLLLSHINKDGTPIYKESAEGWFDPESLKAKEFKWPD